MNQSINHPNQWYLNSLLDIENHNISDIEDWNTVGFNEKLQVSLTIIWSVIIFVGVVANGAVLLVMLCGERLTTATQYFIINLALSDLLFILFCPSLTLISYNQLNFSYILGQLICKVGFFLTQVTALITCLTLMSMTFDRYLVIIHPLKSLSYRTKEKAIAINITIWTLSFLLSLPHAYYRIYVNVNRAGYCTNSNELYDKKIGHINLDQFILLYTVIVAYLIPLFTIIFCYSIMITKLSTEKKLLRNSSVEQKIDRQNKRQRVLLMIASVTLLFCLTWLPIHCIQIALKFFPHSFPIWSKGLYIFKAFSHTLTYSNSMINPFLYTIIGNNFRKRILSRRDCLKLVRLNNESSRIKIRENDVQDLLLS